MCPHPTPPKEKCQERWCDNIWHVGMPCTLGGGECKANIDLVGDGSGGLGAVLCTAPFDANHWFCTKPCGDSKECGPGASCEGDEKGHGCVLSACVGPPDPPDALASKDGDAQTMADTASATDAVTLADAATK